MQIIQSLSEVSDRYDALLCDLWGCLHDGVHAFPEAVAALRDFRAKGGCVILLTNAPRPWEDVEKQLASLGVPADCWDGIATSGEAAREALFRGIVGEKVYHIGPDKDLGLFTPPPSMTDPVPIERVPLKDAEGIVCTGLFDDRSETPEDYRATLLYAREMGLKLLCANPDIAVDLGGQRIFCAGAIARLYTEMGGESLYFGKPYPPIYNLVRNMLVSLGKNIADDRILAIGDGIDTDIKGAMGEGLDTLFVTGGLAAEETGTAKQPTAQPQKDRLTHYLETKMMTPTYAIGFLR